MVFCVHKANKTTILVKISAIINQTPVLAVIKLLMRPLIEPMIFETLKL